MAYSILSLKAPGGRLRRAASSVLTPLNRQPQAVAQPDYGQQIGQMMSAMPSPEYSPNSPNAHNTGDFTFTNDSQAAFAGAPAATGTAAAAAPPPVKLPNGQQVDYSQDPILQQATAAINAQIAQAEAAAVANEKQSLIRYGSGDLLRKVLGDQADQASVDAANNNTYGTVQELGR